MQILIIRLASLLSFIGGPLYLCDLLKPYLGELPAFVIAFSPVGFMALGALSLGDNDRDWLSSLAVLGGLGGAGALTIENILTIGYFMTGAAHPNQWMISFGIAVGLGAVAAYTHLALSFFRRQSTPEVLNDNWDAPD
ncbi:MAG: hypothetical protein HN348_03040 [Proteobacteria bacterium]|jgi:hypothetical protein|nr:hypothetical protein [Pseudomonadota bacterium]